MLPLAIGVGLYGAAFGLLAAQAGITFVETGAMGGLVFAGSAQFVAVERLQAGAGALAALTGGVIINIRFLLMTASLRPELRGRSWWQVLLAVHLTTDQSWALMHAARAKGDPAGYSYLLGSSTFLLVVWLLSTLSGAGLAELLPPPEQLGLDFAFTAGFIAVLVSLFKSARQDLPPWVVAAMVAAGLSLLAPQTSSWAMIAGGLAGAFFAAIRGLSEEALAPGERS